MSDERVAGPLPVHAQSLQVALRFSATETGDIIKQLLCETHITWGLSAEMANNRLKSIIAAIPC